MLVYCIVEPDTLLPILELPSAGADGTGRDQGWPGMVWYDEHLWISYHSGHEAQETGAKACVYLAKVKLPDA